MSQEKVISQKQIELWIRHCMVLQLKNKGLKNIEISRKLGISKQLVHHDLFYLKTNHRKVWTKADEMIKIIDVEISDSAFVRKLSKPLYKVLLEWLEMHREPVNQSCYSIKSKKIENESSNPRSCWDTKIEFLKKKDKKR